MNNSRNPRKFKFLKWLLAALGISACVFAVCFSTEAGAVARFLTAPFGLHNSIVAGTAKGSLEAYMGVFHRFLSVLAAHGSLILFGWVAIEAFGAPLPSVPLLLVTGVLTAAGKLSFVAVWASGVLGCTIGDVIWYCVGRKWGASVLRKVHAIWQRSYFRTMDASQLVARYGNRAVLVSKLLPGPCLVAVPLAASGSPLSTFLAYEIAGSVAFVGGWLFVGRLVGDRLELLSWLTHFAVIAPICLVAAVALVLIAFRFKQRQYLKRGYPLGETSGNIYPSRPAEQDLNPQTLSLDLPEVSIFNQRERNEKNMMHPSLKVAYLIAFTAPTLLLAGCHQKLETAADQPIPVRVQSPRHVQQPVSVAVSGTVEANITALTAFQVGGRVLHVYVQEGQHVVKGQLLADLDPTDYRNGFDAAAGQADAASALNAKAKAGLRQQELEQARIDFDRWQDEYNRMRYLFEHKSLPANDFTKIEAGFNAARERYDMAKSGTRTEDKLAASAQYNAATAQMQEAKKRLADCQLRAPIDGFIGMRQLEVGVTVAPGLPVISVVDLNPVKVRVGIPESEVGKVHEGARAAVSIPSLDGKQFEGRVEAIAAASDPASRTYVSKIVVPNPSRVLLAGMVSEAHLFGDTQVNAITVPGSAIVRDARGVSQVFVLAPGQNRVSSKRVEVGTMIDNQVEVRSGLTGNEQVVVDGQQNVREGSLVKIEGGSR
jgi:membrane fusion protein (multidrug efflux system)